MEVLSEGRARSLARDAYLYAYPIVLMDVTMRQIPTTNAFMHARAFPPGDARAIVRPNFDTLYSVAWLDVRREPVVLSVPEMGERFYLMQMLDMWTDVFAAPGTRTTGNGAGHFAIVAPDWTGELPSGVDLIRAPTSVVWILGRTQTNGPGDYAAVHRVQDAYELTRFGGGAFAAPSSTLELEHGATPPAEQVRALDGVAILERLAALLAEYPPHPNDYPILFRLRALGIEPGKPFDASGLSAGIRGAINAGARDAYALMERSLAAMGESVDHWNILFENIGTYGTSYKSRAVIAMGGLGANLPEDAVYPVAFVDAEGATLIGDENYVVHFDRGKLPPADAFWSLTLYGEDSYQVPNPLNRFALGDRDPLRFNAGGSLDLYVQADSPGRDRVANWLPSPRGKPFNLTMRIYLPRSSVFDGTWRPPRVEPMHARATRPSRAA